MAILYSYAELLEYNPLKKDLIAMSKNEIQQMNDLVDTLLSIARYDNSTIILKKESFLLTEVIHETICSFGWRKNHDIKRVWGWVWLLPIILSNCTMALLR